MEASWTLPNVKWSLINSTGTNQTKRHVKKTNHICLTGLWRIFSMSTSRTAKYTVYKFLTNLTIDQLLVQLQDLIRWLQSSRQIVGHNRRKTCLAHQEKYPHLGKPAIFWWLLPKWVIPRSLCGKEALLHVHDV